MDLAIVGLDSIYWPKAFADAVKSLGGEHRITAVCDLGCSEAEVTSQIGVTAPGLAKEYGARLCHTVSEAAGQAQACLVCTRNSRMPGIVEQLLSAGIPVYVAKPVARDAKSIRRVLLARRRSGLSCAAGQVARSAPGMRTALRLIREGTVGEVLSVRVSHQHGRFADWSPDWWYRDPGEGDPFLWLGWYCIDMATALTGQAIDRLAGADRRLLEKKTGMPDLIRGLATLADGRVATLEIHFTLGDWGVRAYELEVVGSAGVLRVAGPAQEVTILGNGATRAVAFDPGPDQLALEIDAWLRSIGGSGRPVLSLDESAPLVLASLAWRKASREGRWVKVEHA